MASAEGPVQCPQDSDATRGLPQEWTIRRVVGVDGTAPHTARFERLRQEKSLSRRAVSTGRADPLRSEPADHGRKATDNHVRLLLSVSIRRKWGTRRPRLLRFREEFPRLAVRSETYPLTSQAPTRCGAERGSTALILDETIHPGLGFDSRVTAGGDAFRYPRMSFQRGRGGLTRQTGKGAPGWCARPFRPQPDERGGTQRRDVHGAIKPSWADIRSR